MSEFDPSAEFTVMALSPMYNPEDSAVIEGLRREIDRLHREYQDRITPYLNSIQEIENKYSPRIILEPKSVE